MSPLSFRYKYKNVWVKTGDEKNWEKHNKHWLQWK